MNAFGMNPALVGAAWPAAAAAPPSPGSRYAPSSMPPPASDVTRRNERRLTWAMSMASSFYSCPPRGAPDIAAAVGDVVPAGVVPAAA